MKPDDYWRVSDATLERIDKIRQRLDAGEDKVRLAVSLRKQLDLEQATFVLTQAELQIRGRRKFTKADRMLFTPVGLEQATSEVVSHYKATLFPKSLPCFDICCGIGGDAIGLGTVASLVCVDRDPLTSQLAAHNLRVNGVEQFEVLTSDFESVKIPSEALVHIDPDRRTQGRTVRPENFSPPLGAIVEKLVAANSQRTVCVKLAPATRFEEPLRFPHFKMWLGHQRECKQQLLWMGEGCEGSFDRVAILDREGKEFSFEAGSRLGRQVVAGKIEDWILEPHSAILSADLVDEFATEHGLGRLSFGSVYLTGSKKVDGLLAASFRVLETCAMKAKVIKSALESLDIGIVEWKSRGLDQKTVSRLSKIKSKGSNKGVVILTRLGDKFVSYICERSG